MTSGPQHKARSIQPLKPSWIGFRRRRSRTCGNATATCSGPNRQKRSVRTCFGEALPIGSRKRPMAASQRIPDGSSISWSRPLRRSPTVAWIYPGGSSRAPNWCGPGIGGPIGSWSSRRDLPTTERPSPACQRSPPSSPGPNGMVPGSLASDRPDPVMEVIAMPG